MDRMHRPVPHQPSDMQMYDGFPRNHIFQDEQCVDGPDFSATLSPPYIDNSLVTVHIFKGVFFKPEDFETGFASQPPQVSQDPSNGTSPQSLTNTRINFTHFQSPNVTHLSILPYVCDRENDFEDKDRVQLLDYGQRNKESSPPAKKRKLDTSRTVDRPEYVQPRVRQSVRQPVEDELKESNKQEGQVITLAVQCVEWNCSGMFTTDEHKTAVEQLNQHLKDVHSIGLSRCMVLYCAESFPNNRALGQHIKHFHPGIKEWNCSKCPKYFTSYKILVRHKIGQHQLGQFQCSFSACTFTADCKAKVVNHWENHRVKPELVCQAKSGCVYRTTKPSLLKVHERAHLGIKPYRCDWLNCNYSSVTLSGILTHIKRFHFNAKTGSNDVVALHGKASDYFSADRSLL